MQLNGPFCEQAGAEATATASASSANTVFLFIPCKFKTYKYNDLFSYICEMKETRADEA